MAERIVFDDPMAEVLYGQLRNLDKRIKVTVMDSGRGERFRWVLAKVVWGGARLTFLLQEGPNIKETGDPPTGWWWKTAPSDRNADVTCLFYGGDDYASGLGSVADCNGNQNKEDYRRVERSHRLSQVVSGYPVYAEIQPRMTEDNLRRLFNGRNPV